MLMHMMAWTSSLLDVRTCPVPFPLPVLHRILTYLSIDNLNYINGIGLPQFSGFRLPDPQPPSRQILNNSENSQLDDFLNSFDNQSLPVQGVNHGFSLNQFQDPNAFLGMPPNFVGSESVMIGGNGHEVHDWQMDNFTFQNSIPHTDVHTIPNLQHPAFGHVSQANPTTAQLAPIYSNAYQQQPFQPQGQPLQNPGRGPVPNFGSDAHFQPSGFNHIPDQAHASPLQDELWLSSNPNTRPPTQPSSPMIGRKRKPEAEHTSKRNGFIPSPRRVLSPPQPRRLSYIKAEPVQEPTPHASLDNQSPLESDADAGAESDADYPSQTATPPVRRTSTKPAESASAKTKKKNASTKNSKATHKSASRPKAGQRNSSNQMTRRQPLTLDQKKANHTNSEQRRRDATARAQARLFDLIPDVRSAPQKQSTVQKLTKVVDHVPSVKQALSGMRALLYGRDDEAEAARDSVGTSETDAIDAAAAGALAGMGSVDSSLMFGNPGGLDGGSSY